MGFGQVFYCLVYSLVSLLLEGLEDGMGAQEFLPGIHESDEFTVFFLCSIPLEVGCPLILSPFLLFRLFCCFPKREPRALKDNGK